MASVGMLATCSGAGDQSPLGIPVAVTEMCGPAGRLPVSGLCRDEVATLMQEASPVLAIEQSCHWEAQELALMKQDVLLYRGLTCDGVTTELAHGADALASSVVYTSSVFEHDKNHLPLWVFGDGSNEFTAKAVSDRLILTLPEASRSACALLSSDDGFQIQAAQSDTPVDCGRFGARPAFDQVWRDVNGYAVFYSMDPKAQDIDPTSFIVVTPTKS